ncbi:MAG: glycosyltransferase [Rhodospirillaceae bacterium]|nr:glycosyltransferase [Rhodospirillaceae bacterium]
MPSDALPHTPDRKRGLRALFDRLAPVRDRWIDRNRYFYRVDHRFMRFLVAPGQKVLDLGCGTGRLLAALEPSEGVGVDLSPAMIAEARSRPGPLDFLVGDMEDPAVIDALAARGPFDVIVLSDTLGFLDDCQAALERLQALSGPHTRIIVAHYSHLWEPVLKLGTALGARMPSGQVNWLSSAEIVNLLALGGFEPIKREWRTLVPRRLLGLGSLVNRFLAPLPLIRLLCLRHYVVARSRDLQRPRALSCSVVVPARNERGNIEAAVQRLPQFAPDQEIVFVEGHSSDGTWDEILRVQAAYPDHKITCLQQPGRGKGDAVRAAFDAASGDVLVILDADLTVPPEDIPKFHRLIERGQADFVNGTRFVYPMEREAMRFLNYWANRVFATIFSYLLNQSFTDTLCGTKVLTASAYRRIAANRAYFGDFDPFGDFDLIFGAAKLNLKIVEVPVRYAARSYGSTQISRFRHGWLLLRMVVFAFRKLKAL